jgi:hypothetical protein
VYANHEGELTLRDSKPLDDLDRIFAGHGRNVTQSRQFVNIILTEHQY